MTGCIQHGNAMVLRTHIDNGQTAHADDPDTAPHTQSKIGKSADLVSIHVDASDTIPHTQMIAHKAGADWDSNPSDQALCTRQEFIDEAIRSEAGEAALATLKDADELAKTLNVETTPIANRAGAEWDIHPHVQQICSRRAYIEQAIREHASTHVAIS